MFEDQQPKEKADFTQATLSLDHFFTINWVLEKTLEHQIELHFTVVHYSKEIDFFKTQNFMIKALLN